MRGLYFKLGTYSKCCSNCRYCKSVYVMKILFKRCEFGFELNFRYDVTDYYYCNEFIEK